MATIRCDAQCNSLASFGPGPDEVTVLGDVESGPPHMAQVYGFDGVQRDEIDLAGVQEGSGIADIAWSPDGTRLAVSTFTGPDGAREPDCPRSSECVGRVWLLDAAGTDPVLVYRQSAPPQAYIEQSDPVNPPMLTDLAWAPDGDRLGPVSSTFYPERADPPRLVAITVESGQAETLYEFDDCGTCNPARYGFAWSPDGTRVAVTSGTRIVQLSSDGATTLRPLGSGSGPLAWLVKPPA